MKKIGIVVLVVLLGFLYFSTRNSIDFNDTSDKSGSWVTMNADGSISNSSGEIIDMWGISAVDKINENNPDIEEPEESIVEVEYLTDNNFIEMDTIDESKIPSWRIDITWKILNWVNVDKVVVEFSNKDSEFKDSYHQLTKFKSGDKTFLYHAFSEYQALDFWKNVYTISAYSWNDVSKANLIINVKDEDEEVLSEEERLENLIEEKNLTSEESKNIIQELWISSDLLVDSLKISKKSSKNIVCKNKDDVTVFVNETVKSWFFWNTCRNMVKDKLVSVYVLRINWTNYTYEKHYADYTKWFYWVLELESWTDYVTKENMEEKNVEFMNKNSSFKDIEKADKLFIEIVSK